MLQNHMCVNADGTWRVCCKFMHAPRPTIKTTSFEKFKNSNDYQNVVETMKRGWHPGCINCKQTEDSMRRESLREYANRTYSSEPGIESIEFSLSNHCNLRCRMCGPKYSDKWAQLIDENPHLIKTQFHDQYSAFEDNEVDLKASDLLEGVDISKLKIVKYLGGEPFVSPQLLEFFKILDDRGVIGNVEFQVNTNCTLFPEKYVPWLLKFSGLVVTLSIDGYGDLNEYIRDGQPWSVVEKAAIEWSKFSWKSNTNLIISPTVQAYNVHDIENLRVFARKNSIKLKKQHLVRPRHFSLNALPKEYLEEIRTVENNEEIDDAVFNPGLWRVFKEFTLDLDSAMGKSIEKHIPKLYRYFDV